MLALIASCSASGISQGGSAAAAAHDSSVEQAFTQQQDKATWQKFLI
jgi:hypothetical protein